MLSESGFVSDRITKKSFDDRTLILAKTLQIANFRQKSNQIFILSISVLAHRVFS